MHRKGQKASLSKRLKCDSNLYVLLYSIQGKRKLRPKRGHEGLEENTGTALLFL